jgi:alkaline phosphatase
MLINQEKSKLHIFYLCFILDLNKSVKMSHEDNNKNLIGGFFMTKKYLKLTKYYLLLVLVMMMALGACSSDSDDDNDQEDVAKASPKYVFYFIGDGMGAAQRQSAELYMMQVEGADNYSLNMNKLSVAGINSTYSSDSMVTDSAAAGTALATGYKTNNGVISKLPDGTDLKSLIEAAEENGKKTGIVSSTRLTHATPAVFASHNINRNNENDIAADFVDSGVDYFAGGGYRHFVGKDNAEGLKSKRTDDRDLVAEFEALGYTSFVSEDETENFKNHEMQESEKVIALMTYSHLPYEIDRKNTGETSPSLAELTEKGIELLSQGDEGFFMMVEGGRIDHACHANDIIGSVYDTLIFDEALGKAYEFYEAHPNETLIVVVGDHETGGMGLGFGKEYRLNFENISEAKVSIADTLPSAYQAGGDRDAYFVYLEENLGLTGDYALTEDEKAKIQVAMDWKDNSENQYIYGGYDVVATTVAYIISERVNMQWTTYAHSGTQIPMSAIGVGAEEIGGYKDNTEIAWAMAKVLNYDLTQSVEIASADMAENQLDLQEELVELQK